MGHVLEVCALIKKNMEVSFTKIKWWEAFWFWFVDGFIRYCETHPKAYTGTGVPFWADVHPETWEIWSKI